VAEWPTARVEAIADVVAMGPFGSSIKVETFVSEGVPVISGQHLRGSKVDGAPGFHFITPAHADRLRKANVTAGDVVFTHAGNIGQVAMVPRDAPYERYVISQRQFYVRCKPDRILPEFLVAFFTTREGQRRLLANASQVGVPSIARPVSYLRSVEVPIPPLGAQRHIAGILGTLDDKIELNRRMSETLEAAARALFRSWFVNDVHPGSTVRGLDQIAVFLNGLALQKFRPTTHGSLPVIKISQLRSGDTRDADLADADLPADYVVRDGDVLFSWSGSLECVLWAGGNGALNQHLFKVTSIDFPKWFYYLWIHQHLADFREIAAGKATTMGHIQRHHLSQARVVVPEAAVLAAADRVLGPMINQIILRKVEARTLAEVRDAFLPRLVSGDLRPRDAAQFVEPAPT
jgi:type I restriction enzyme, S subunit